MDGRCMELLQAVRGACCAVGTSAMVPMGIPYMSLTRDWISATVNHPDHAVNAHKRPLTVCALGGCQGCMHDGALSGCHHKDHHAY